MGRLCTHWQYRTQNQLRREGGLKPPSLLMPLELLLMSSGDDKIDGDGLLHITQVNRSTLVYDPDVTVSMAQISMQRLVKDSQSNFLRFADINRQTAIKETYYNQVAMHAINVQALFIED